MDLLDVRVKVRLRVERRRAVQALVQDLAGVGGAVFLEGRRIFEALFAKFTAVLFLAVHLPLVGFEGELVGRLLAALVANVLLVCLRVFGDHVLLEGGFVVENFVALGALYAGVLDDAHVSFCVFVEAGLGFELATARVADHSAFVGVHVDHVSAEGALSGENFVAQRARIQLVTTHVRCQLAFLDETFRAFVTLEGAVDCCVRLHPVKFFVLLCREAFRTEIATVKVRIEMNLDVLQQMAPLEQFLVAAPMKALLIVYLSKVPP